MYLVFDIGATNTRLATSNDLDELENIVKIPTPENFEEGIKIFAEEAKKICANSKIKAIAGGIAGPMSKDKSASFPPNLPNWSGKPLQFEIEEAMDCKVYLENDAALAGLGEAVYGPGRGKRIVGYLTISTGVGGVKIIDGRIDPNNMGFEPGHQIIVPNGAPCGCGGLGHLESYVSGTGIQKIYGKNAEDIDDGKIWDEVLNNLAIGLNNVSVLWSPDLIILGGSVMNKLPIDKLRNKFSENLKIFNSHPEIIRNGLGDEVGMYGAMALLKSKF